MHKQGTYAKTPCVRVQPELLVPTETAHVWQETLVSLSAISKAIVYLRQEMLAPPTVSVARSTATPLLYNALNRTVHPVAALAHAPRGQGMVAIQLRTLACLVCLPFAPQILIARLTSVTKELAPIICPTSLPPQLVWLFGQLL